MKDMLRLGLQDRKQPLLIVTRSGFLHDVTSTSAGLTRFSVPWQPTGETQNCTGASWDHSWVEAMVRGQRIDVVVRLA